MAEFQFNTRLAMGPGTSAGAATAAPRLGVQQTNGQVGVQRYNSHYGNEGSALDAVPAFLQGIAKRNEEKANQAAMWQGFTNARAGQTMQQIDAEQPWYANMFGPTNYELGAATFHIAKAGADFDASFTANLNDLRQLPPEEIGQKLNDMSNEQMTGNVYADDQIMTTMMQKAGPLMESHTKARVAWQNEELSKARYGAWSSQGVAHQTAMVENTTLNGGRPDDAFRREREAILVREHMYDGVSDPKLWMEDLGRRTVDAAERGEFFVVDALEKNFAGAFPPEEKEKWESRIQAGRAKFRRKMPFDPRMNQIVMDNAAIAAGFYSAEETISKMTEQDAQYFALTGDTEPLNDFGDYEQGATSALTQTLRAAERANDRIYARREKALAAGDKDAADAHQDSAVAGAFVNGTLGTLVRDDPSAKPKAERVMSMSMDEPNFPALLVASSVGKVPFKSSLIVDSVRSRVQASAGEEYTEGFETEFNRWKAIRDVELKLPGGGIDRTSGIGTAAHYYGPENHAKFMRYEDLRRAGQAPPFAYMAAFGNEVKFGRGDIRGVNAKESIANRAAIMKYATAGNPYFGKGLSTSSAEQVAWTASKHFETLSLSPGLTPDQKAKKAVEMAFSEGNLEKSGQYVWSNGNADQTLAGHLRMDPDTFSNIFDQYLTNKLRAERVSVDGSTSTMIMRVGDEGGSPRLLVQALNGAGKFITMEINSKDLKEVQKRAAEHRRAKPSRDFNAIPTDRARAHL